MVLRGVRTWGLLGWLDCSLLCAPRLLQIPVSFRSAASGDKRYRPSRLCKAAMWKYFKQVAQEMKREDLVLLPTYHEAKVSLSVPFKVSVFCTFFCFFVIKTIGHAMPVLHSEQASHGVEDNGPCRGGARSAGRHPTKDLSLQTDRCKGSPSEGL